MEIYKKPMLISNATIQGIIPLAAVGGAVAALAGSSAAALAAVSAVGAAVGAATTLAGKDDFSLSGKRVGLQEI